MSESIWLFVWVLGVILVGFGAVIWAESIPTDQEIILKDKRYQVRKIYMED